MTKNFIFTDGHDNTGKIFKQGKNPINQIDMGVSCNGLNVYFDELKISYNVSQSDFVITKED